MKTLFFLISAFLFFPIPAKAQTAGVVLAASATSSAPGSSPITCLLDPNCNGYWSPGSSDSGTDEGIYIQFENPVTADFIDVNYEGGDISPFEMKVYLNGKTQGKNGIYWLKTSSSSAGSTFRIGEGREVAPLQEKIKSVFLKLDNLAQAQDSKGFRIKKIQFLSAQGAPLSLTLPQMIAGSVSATSILEPITAYHPAHLVDSKYDMAWSTDGKKVSGKGESVTFNFSTPQTLSGLMVWNGYQRSDTHFAANGRVSDLEVKPGGGAAQTVKLQDRMGPQKVTFATPMTGVSQVTLTLQGIIPGSQYKDVLLSELRFVDAKGGMILPTAPLPTASAPAGFANMINRSFSSFINQPSTEGINTFCDNARIRLRQDGSFVIYKGFDYGKEDDPVQPANVNANVLEGNWEPKTDKIRIFGRQYLTALKSSEYMQELKPAAPRVGIFQSEVSIKPYTQLTPAEKQTLFAALWAKKKGPATKNQKLIWVIGVAGGNIQQPAGANYDELVKNMDMALQALNPYYIQSSVVSDLMLPTDQTTECFTGI